MMYKQLALSAPLIGLLFCLTACNKKEAPQKPDVNEKVLGYVEKRTIETTVGKEFGVEVSNPTGPCFWGLLISAGQHDPVTLVRREQTAQEGKIGEHLITLKGSETTRWVFRATEPGEHTILMARIWENSWQKSSSYLEVNVLVKP